MHTFRISRRTLFIIICFLLLVVQNGLEMKNNAFSYIDEFVALIGLAYIAISVGQRRQALKNKKVRKVINLLFLFLLSGVLGNVIYSYQPFAPVLIDIFTNIKFYICIAFGYLLFTGSITDKYEDKFRFFGKAMTLFFAALSIVDVLFSIFPSQYRYGIKSLVLFYYHPTYFSGALCAIIVILVLFYNKSCYKYIIIDVVLMALTLRSKAIAAAGVIAFVTWHILKRKKKLNKWQIIVAGMIALGVVWEQVQFYFVVLSGRSARSVLTLTSFKILKDYFPIGTGFATFGSNMAKVYYSPVYVKYGFLMINEVSANNQSSYLNDTFWPIIIGQTGVIGTIAYVSVVLFMFSRIWKMRLIDNRAFCSSICAFLYLIISSTAEPAFNNSISIILAFVIGFAIKKTEIMSMNNPVPNRNRK